MPPVVSDAEKGQNVQLSFGLLRMLQVREHRAWHDAVTLDESWCQSNLDDDFIWPRYDETIHEGDSIVV
jgi:hypothetical protein